MSCLGRTAIIRIAVSFVTLSFAILVSVPALAQASGASGTVQGKVLDPSGAVIPGATVEMTNPVSGYRQSTVSDDNGQFGFRNVPFSNYQLSVSHAGFQATVCDVTVRGHW
jgi:protocatechuate 3,4-dioxygenase beta subunit